MCVCISKALQGPQFCPRDSGSEEHDKAKNNTKEKGNTDYRKKKGEEGYRDEATPADEHNTASPQAHTSSSPPFYLPT